MENNLTLSPSDAKKLYPSASGTFKEMLEESFGKENLVEKKITDRIQSFLDVLDIAGKTMEDLVGDKDDPHDIAVKQAKLVAKVYNEGWVRDLANPNEYGYFPVYKHVAGVGLSYYYYDFWFTSTSVGPRLEFKSAALVEDAVKKCPEMYRAFFS